MSVRDRYPRRTPAVAVAKAVLVCAALAGSASWAEPPTNARYANTQLPDRAQEAKARALMLTLRCVVCQGQSIADSDAAMAGDMRALVRRRIASGASPESIRHWMVARYGDYVSYDPPLSGITWPLWIAPFLLLGLGAWIARGSFRRRR